MKKKSNAGVSYFILLEIVFLIITVFQNRINAQKFVIPVFPDTQTEVHVKMDMFNSQLNWIVQHKDSMHIPFVLHVGDIVNYDNITHWQNASAGFSLLDQAQIPYAVCLGNHDTEAVGENSGSAAPGNTRLNLRKTTKFNTYFPISRFKAQKGRYEAGKSDNAYYTFTAGGLKWMVMSLEFCARQGPVDWADSVVAKNPGFNVIVLTHYHLNTAGEISTSNAGYGDLSPFAIYNQFIKKHANILLVLSGHLMTSAWRNDIGDNGNHIYQLLQDYQDQDYGGGYLRLLEIDTMLKTMSAKMYSPYYNKTKQDASLFQFSDVKFMEDITPVPQVNASGAKNIFVYPSPAKKDQDITVKMSGMNDVELIGAQLSVYSALGTRIYHSDKVEQLNVLRLKPMIGMYSGNVSTVAGKGYSFKILVSK